MNDPKTSAKVLRALRDGWGVEDMQVQGLCSAEYARSVIGTLRKMGLMHEILGLRKP